MIVVLQVYLSVHNKSFYFKDCRTDPIETYLVSLISSAREQEGTEDTSVEKKKSNFSLLVKRSLSLDETGFPHGITRSL